jgi:hypothetical protein
MAKSFFQYCRRVNVLLTSARVPLFSSFLAAASAFAFDSNSP